MILSIKISLHNWSCNVEIDNSATFEDLHYLIQTAVEFDDDHLYEFFTSSSERSRDKEEICSYENSNAIQLKQFLPTPADTRLFYLFDYGDNWLFRISLTRKAPFVAVSDIEYPRLVRETGERPMQYPDCEE